MAEDDKYWKRCGFTDFRGKLLLPLRDFNIHYIEGDLYSRCGSEDLSLQIISAVGFNNDPSRDGECLILRVQGFKPYFSEPMRNKEKDNEISLWLTVDAAEKLRDFLNHVLAKKPQNLSDFL